jgi:hypothetical protein
LETEFSLNIPILPVLWVQTHIRSVRGEALDRASGEEISFILSPFRATSRPNPCTATILILKFEFLSESHPHFLSQSAFPAYRQAGTIRIPHWKRPTFLWMTTTLSRDFCNSMDVSS